MDREAVYNGMPAGTASSRLPYVFILALFLAELVFDRMLEDMEGARVYQMLVALARFAILSFMALVYLGPAIFHGRPPGFRAPGKSTAVIAVSFLAVVCFSGLVGLAYGNPFSYVMGDMFKFAVFPVMLIAVYMGVRSSEDFHRLLLATVFIYALFLLKTMVMYVAVWGVHKRPVSIYIYPFMPFLTLYLRERTKGRRLSSLLGALLVYYLFCFPALVWYSQSLSLILEAGFLGAATWLLHNRVGKAVKAALIGVSATAALFVSFFLFYPMTLFGLFEKMTGGGSYLSGKFNYLKVYGLSVKGLVMLGGDRLSNVLEVAGSFYKDPLKFIAGGQGMGSVIKITSVAGMGKASKLTEMHFIENAFPEVLYRSGAIGLVLYVSLFAGLLWKALRWRKENLFCAFASAYAVYILVFSIFNMGFVGEGIGSLYMVGVVFAGVWLVDSQYLKAGMESGRTAI